MSRVVLYVALAPLFLNPATVFASLFPQTPQSQMELAVKTSGMELIWQVDAALNRTKMRETPIRAVVAISREEARLATALDQALDHWFIALAKNPSEEIMESAVDQLLFIFLSHLGAEAFKDQNLRSVANAVIQDFIKPLNERDPGSCLSMLDPNNPATFH